MLKDLYLKNSMIPKRYLEDIPLIPSSRDEQTFIELNEIKKDIRGFVNRGDNLLICSNSCGNGKTTFATKMLKSFIEESSMFTYKYDTPVLFVNVNNFLNDKKLAINDKAIANRVKKIEKAILTAKLVVFDDIADKTLSEYDMNTMYYWLDYRTSNKMSCIYTSNQTPPQLKSTLNGKMYSRIVNYSIVKEITDGDHRGC